MKLYHSFYCMFGSFYSFLCLQTSHTRPSDPQPDGFSRLDGKIRDFTRCMLYYNFIMPCFSLDDCTKGDNTIDGGFVDEFLDG